MLPSLEAFEICKQIRQSQMTSIMMVSAKKEDIDKIRGLGLGADDYLIKPFSPSELVARVKAHIARYDTLVNAHKPVSQLINVGDLMIDSLGHHVYVNNQNVTLTSKEFALLDFLAQRSNRVWPKEELFESVWGLDVLDTEVSTVVVHIKRIREKLKQAGLVASHRNTMGKWLSF